MDPANPRFLIALPAVATRATITLAAVLLAGCAETEEPTPEQATQLAPAAETPIATTHTAVTPDGAALYTRHCGSCHDAGDGHPGTMRIAARADGTHSVLLERTDLSAAYVALVIRSGIQMMPPFRPSELSDAEIKPLAAYVAQQYEGAP